jgi:hypothetical protein
VVVDEKGKKKKKKRRKVGRQEERTKGRHGQGLLGMDF